MKENTSTRRKIDEEIGGKRPGVFAISLEFGHIFALLVTGGGARRQKHVQTVD
jgi:hypothetical protein